MIYLKLILALIAGGICWKAIERENRDIAVYWSLVMLYWILNAFGT